MIQLVVATVLFFVMMFGIGFILNMLMKTTWFPLYLLIIIVVAWMVYEGWTKGAMLNNLAEYTIVDWIPAVGGLVGAVLSGNAIQALRKGGYKMF
ncbi:hypothetical protein SY83_00025 [Paenibacillus swuensis]|uniref:Uncharacterized protein n=1 Tax=Paenibacillus swuensis TaxID=1178515 RepID=A0A172TDN0_9BACL|nr:YuiB family protein [Paenibacillus swuensis]ANE45027.1 hypothetical protein SY83_00025 [Paenibacillus swuensis]